MKKITKILFSAIVLLAVFGGRTFAQKDKDDDTRSWNGHDPGTWDAVVKDGMVNIEFYGRHWTEGRNFNAAELGTLPMDRIGVFTLTRDAGKMTFKGVFEDHFGHGTYTFEENKDFRAYLQQKGYTVDDDLMRAVFCTDISRAYFDFMKENGYANITGSQFKDLAEQDMNRKVMQDYFGLFKAEGYGRQPLDKIVELREHGVGPKYIANLHRAGYSGFSLDKAEELRDHGVDANYIATIKKTGYPNLTLDKAEELRDHGVSLQYVKSLQDMGYKDITLDRAEELRDHGVSSNFISEMQQLGYKNLTLEKAQDLRDHGVSPQFIRSINDLGFKDISLDQAEELRNHGVNASFIKKMQDKGVKVKTLEDYIKIRDTGFGND
ncbi:MAG TPA: hypothetical protein VHC47_14655 [Mucilaginibacter sp.]|nr:hypothetical protein [Mucilaginibacter sp.]